MWCCNAFAVTHNLLIKCIILVLDFYSFLFYLYSHIFKYVMPVPLIFIYLVLCIQSSCVYRLLLADSVAVWDFNLDQSILVHVQLFVCLRTFIIQCIQNLFYSFKTNCILHIHFYMCMFDVLLIDTCLENVCYDFFLSHFNCSREYFFKDYFFSNCVGCCSSCFQRSFYSLNYVYNVLRFKD